MHLPDEMLHGAVCPVTAMLSAVGVATAAVAALRVRQPLPSAAKCGAVSALIFAGQLVNFPISGGTSGHLLGGVLASALLGTPLGVLAMSLVVTVQCLIFADGGLSVLGANLLNMAILGAGVGGLLWERCTARRLLDLAGIAWCCVLIGAAACSAELAMAGTVTWAQVLPAMLGVHALIGLGEAVLTVVVYWVWNRRDETLREKNLRPALVGLSALLIGLLIAPFSSRLPDGLEWVARPYAFYKSTAPHFAGLAPDYLFPGVKNAALATSLAGAAGVLAIFAIAWSAASSLTRLRNSAKISAA